MEFLSKEKLYKLYEEEERTGRDFLEWEGEKEFDGLLYTIHRDKRNGNTYATRQTRTVHMGFNDSPPEKIKELCEVVEREGVARASWGVTGRTCHMGLAYDLQKRLTGYRFKIGYNYECEVSKD